ncbi:MAG: MBL fold metallo-hydrolase [Saprospiraceae bacterium]|nr:MBL fold metallo-hydrolase [Saprospiraceae bacterium]
MKILSLNTGYFKLDGGAMFGVIPKVMWNKLNPSDENNLCPWALRCLYLEYGDKKIVIDTGNGDKQDPSFFAHYHLSHTQLIDECLAAHGISANDITDVILTHFHFDHVGGAIKKDKNGQLVPTFPKATYWTNQKHYDWAFTPNPRERASFLKENFVLLQELGILKMIEETGDIVRFDDKISLFFSYGHTEAMMIPIIDTPKGKLIYCADLLPSNWHIGLPYIMAYDIRPFESLAEKIKVLDWALDENAVLFFEHDPNYECCDLVRNAKGRVEMKSHFTLAEWFN